VPEATRLSTYVIVHVFSQPSIGCQSCAAPDLHHSYLTRCRGAYRFAWSPKEADTINIAKDGEQANTGTQETT